MKKIFSILLITCSLSISYAQKITTKTVLSSALKDERLKSNQQLTTLAQGLKFHLPIIKEVQLRLGINGNVSDDTIYGYIRNEDNYGLQLSTNSFREIRQQKLFKQAQVNVYQSENRVLVQQALTERYQSLVAYIFAQKTQKERLKLDSLLTKKHAILRQMMESGLDVKVKEVMDTEGDKNAVQQSLLSLENDLYLSQSKLKMFASDQAIVAIDDADLISITQLTEVLNTQKLLPSNHPLFNNREAKTQLATADLNYINAQNRQIFNMLRLGYNSPLYLERPKKFNIENNFSVRVGLNLPIVGNNNFKRSRALLEERETKIEAEVLRQQNMQSIDFQYVKLENLLKSYKLCQQQIEQSLIKKMLTNDKLAIQMTPLEIVELQLTQQKMAVRAVELAHDITSDYVKFLELTGAMSAAPLKNYLSASLDTF
jgi:hypothetical protein